MPFVPSTPEQHLTLLSPTSPLLCRGISNTGLPCTKSLPPSSITTTTSPPPPGSVITIIANQRTWFCPRHAEQAEDIVLRHTASFARRREAVGRGSLETLIEQVEVIVAGRGGVTPGGTEVGGGGRRTEIKMTTGRIPESVMQPEKGEEKERPPRPPTPPRVYTKKKRGFWRRLFCCCSIPEETEEDLEAARINEKAWSKKKREAELRAAAAGIVGNELPGDPNHHHNHHQQQHNGKKKHVRVETVPPPPVMPMIIPPAPPHSALKKSTPHHTSTTKPPAIGGTPLTLSSSSGTDSEPEEIDNFDKSTLTKAQHKLLPLIPSTLPLAARQKLRAELLRPLSDKDEPGYIYIFWLTDSPLSPFSTPSPSNNPSPYFSTATGHPAAQRLATSLPVTTPTSQHPNLLLKIGRAVNVQRRLHQWSTQCGYNLALIRYYPHTSASSPPAVATPGGNPVGRKVPNVNRVERLIHLELGAREGSNPAHQCQECGKTHKEWFEVEASREGILGVDAVVKKWIAWAEGGADAALKVIREAEKRSVRKSAPAAARPVKQPPPRIATLQVRPAPPPRKDATKKTIPTVHIPASNPPEDANGQLKAVNMYTKSPSTVNTTPKATTNSNNKPKSTPTKTTPAKTTPTKSTTSAGRTRRTAAATNKGYDGAYTPSDDDDDDVGAGNSRARRGRGRNGTSFASRAAAATTTGTVIGNGSGNVKGGRGGKKKVVPGGYGGYTGYDGEGDEISSDEDGWWDEDYSPARK